jgi:iron(III) transport system ATP-binding protein
VTFLVLESVCKRYGDVVALDSVTLRVPAGSRTAIVGPSGSGKTSLLRMIAGFDVPDSGRIMLTGDVLADGVTTMPAYRRGIGVVSQDGALFPHLSIADNIGFGLERGAGRSARIAELVRMVGLDKAMLRRHPDELSGGQQQRVALARAMAREPRLMLLDEPFSALDTALRVSTRKAVADLLSTAGITTVLVTHDQTEALSFADKVGVMRDGRLVQTGTPRDLYLHPRDPGVATFLGDAIVLPATIEGGSAVCALGRIDVADGRCLKEAQIMLRPEQIVLTPATQMGNAAPSNPPLGRIEEVDFGGAVCMVAVRVLNGTPLMIDPMMLRQAGSIALDIGTIVQIAVMGQAHVFTSAEP